MQLLNGVSSSFVTFHRPRGISKVFKAPYTCSVPQTKQCRSVVSSRDQRQISKAAVVVAAVAQPEGSSGDETDVDSEVLDQSDAEFADPPLDGEHCCCCRRCWRTPGPWSCCGRAWHIHIQHLRRP